MIHIDTRWIRRASAPRTRSAALASVAGFACVVGCNVGSESKYQFGVAGAGAGAGGAAGGQAAVGGRTPVSSSGGEEASGAYSNSGGKNQAAASSGGAGAGSSEPTTYAEGGSNDEGEGEGEGGEGGSTEEQKPSSTGGAAEDLSAATSAGAPSIPDCEPEGGLRCAGEGQRERESCVGGEWIEMASCAEGQSCDPSGAACRDVAPECVGRRPGERYCQENELITCSTDTFAGETTTCAGQCAPASGTASCVAPSCGDGIQQTGEACDDGNASGGDGCSPSCRAEPVALASGGMQACAISSEGDLRCWGDNENGELGLGDARSRGSAPSDLGAQLLAPDLGAHRVKSVTTGMSHTCAVLDDDTVRCWGSNASGLLGHGDTVNRGDGPGEMGAALPSTSLGGMGKVTMVAAGDQHTCGLLSGGRVKCWGQNGYGQLGVGDTDARGDAAMEMGDSLPAVDLGPGRTAKHISAGTAHSCAVLDTGNVKCWGRNDRGQLGQGDEEHRGDAPNELSRMVPIDLGAGVTATEVAAGDAHSCALLSDGSVKCWGGNSLGQLGLGTTDDRGDAAGELGAALAPVALGKPARAISSGFNHTCALLADQSVKCWGGNGLGQLGQGDTNHRGDAENELGTLQSVSVGTGRTVLRVAPGRTHNCALLDDRSVRCWGFNSSGQLGSGNNKGYGNASGTMGDALIPVDLRF